ncbi:MAG: phosphonopyruvate decarboxylase [Kiritimatiellia bacterium]
MIEVEEFVSSLESSGVDFFCGVPDSLLKNFCAYVTDHCAARHVIAANEGGAVGLAAGHYLATGRLACVYMQNSGQGNAVNPLVSLADPEVYSIPMLLLVGWRGRPGEQDEPQHAKQGKITLPLFETLGIPAAVLAAEDEPGADGRGRRWAEQVAAAAAQARRERRPVALVAKRGAFGEYRLRSPRPDIADLPRELAIERLLDALPQSCAVVATTGMISRELYETRVRRGEGHGHDFLTVGSMGHAVMIALGIARARPDRQVVCLDGDGAAIMQMGSLAIVGQSACPNLTHVVLNNAAHDSVGGQPTVGGAIDLSAVAAACGYELVRSPDLPFSRPSGRPAPRFLELRVAKGARKDLGRPKEPPQANKELFMATFSAR